MSISAETVKELRNRTQAGFMECKKALEEAGGDLEQAIILIRKRGAALANKRAQRTATEGVIGLAEANTSTGTAIALFELNTETDFVAKNETFQAAVNSVTHAITEFLKNNNTPLTLEGVQALIFTDKDTTEKSWHGQTIGDSIQQLSGTIGEKIEISQVTILKAKAGETIATYAHAGNKIISAVKLIAEKADGKALGKDLAMQVVASAPQYLTESEIPAEALNKEKEVYLGQAMDSGKPKEIAEKMVQGKLKNFYKQVCLVHQPFIKEPKTSVAQHVETEAKHSGGKIEILGFIRLACGESTS
jgi:elongation factor Ts